MTSMYACHSRSGSPREVGLANFSAKFEIDEEPSLLTLNCADYDISPDADYNAWMIIEP